MFVSAVFLGVTVVFMMYLVFALWSEDKDIMPPVAFAIGVAFTTFAFAISPWEFSF